MLHQSFAQHDMPAAIDALQRQALQPAPMASAAFAAAIAHLPASAAPVPLLVRKQGGAPLAAALLNLKGWRWQPFWRLASSRWGDFYMGGPLLLHKDHASEGLAALLEELRRRRFAALELATVPLEGPFAQTLHEVAAAQQLPMTALARWQRAVLDCRQGAQEWWHSLPKKRRKEWQRLKRRLEQQGQLVFEQLAADAALDPWLEDFLALERAGWKGRRGTAIACHAHLVRFVRAMTRHFHAQGALRFWRLRLDGQTIAALFGFRLDDELWLGKIAYDERWRQYSPGVLLTIEATCAILAEPGLRLADSAADPDHPMIDHLWRQRRAYGDVLLGVPGTSPAAFALLCAAERARRAVRNRAKRLLHLLRRR